MSQNVYYNSGYLKEVSQSHGWRTAQNSLGFILSKIKQSDKILDVGCGPGTITVDIAQYVLGGKVIGIDTEQELIDEARAEAKSKNVTNIEFKVGTATSLPFEDESFDIVYAHQVLLHLSDPVNALFEMKRVVKKGGIVCCRDADLVSTIVYPLKFADPIRYFFLKKSRRETTSITGGRELINLALQSGFQSDDISYTCSSWCIANKIDREWFQKLYHDRLNMSKDEDKDEFSKKEIEDAWSSWVCSADGVLILVHGEIICRK